MNTRVRKLLLAMAIVAGLAGAAVGTGSPAWASYPHDNTNPHTTGCDATGTAANPPYSTVAIYDPEISGDVLGYVELRWSTSCTTNWSRVTMRSGAPYAVPGAGAMTWAYRPSDGASTWGHDGDPGPYYAASVYSDQLYGNGLTVCAYGRLAYQSINGPTQWAEAHYCF
jgi:hypothetical protein